MGKEIGNLPSEICALQPETTRNISIGTILSVLLTAGGRGGGREGEGEREKLPWDLGFGW